MFLWYTAFNARFWVPVSAEHWWKLHCALLQIAYQTCIRQIFFFLVIGVYGIITGIQLELLQMFPSTDKEREAKMMPSPCRFFSSCWKPCSLHRGTLMADRKPGWGAEPWDSLAWVSECSGERAGSGEGEVCRSGPHWIVGIWPFSLFRITL